MARSHPPSLIRLVERTLKADCQPMKGEHVLVAVSGGGDSLALLHVLARLRQSFGFLVSAHGVDHGFRPEAADELRLAGALAESLGVPFETSQVNPGLGGNLQARARDARYAALEQAAHRVGATLIATGHHADDRAETVLIRLLRGAGPHGLAVLPARSGGLLRPMVRARRADIQAHLARHRIAYAQDPSNQNLRFLRVQIRQELLPQLERLSPRIVEHLCSLADDLRNQPPVVVDPSGKPIRLGRAQVEDLRHALDSRNPRARILLAGGQSLEVDKESGIACLVTGELHPSADPGDAKPGDRG